MAAACFAVVALFMAPPAQALAPGKSVPSTPEAAIAAPSASVDAATRSALPHAIVSGHQVSWRTAAASGYMGAGGGLAAIGATGSAIAFSGTGGTPGTTSRYWLSNDSWTLLSPPNSPSYRWDYAFHGDPPLDEDVLFGGETNILGYESNQTWLYGIGNDTWWQVGGSVAPTPRQDTAFAIAPYLSEGFLYGGWNESTGVVYGDDWIFNLTTNTWWEISPGGSSPSRLAGASLVWDNTNHRFDMFGGCYLGCSSVLWEFDPYNLTWSSIATGTSPPARELASFEFDAQQGTDVLFGGETGSGALADTWVLNVTSMTWALQTLTTVPPARYDAAATWLHAPQNGSFLMAGGYTGSGAVLSDAWLASAAGSVPVQVVSATTDLPVASATVTADGSFAALTNAQGFGNASGVASGSAVVAASAPGYTSASQSLWLYPGTTSALVILKLVPNPQGEIIVRVKSALWPHVPLAGVDVNVSIGGVLLQNPPKTTNAQGYANYTNVPTGLLAVLTAWRPGYYPNQTSFSVPVATSVAWWNSTLEALPFVTVHTMGYNVAGPGDLYDFAGVAVSFAGGLYGPSGNNGWLNVSFDRSGALSVEGTYTNYASAWDNVTLGATGEFYSNLTLPAATGSTFLIHVTNQSNGAAWPGAYVNDSFVGGPWQGFTNASGDLRDGRLRSGPNEVTVWAPGAYPQLNYVWLFPGQVWHENISLVTLPVLHLRVWGKQLNGTVDPLPGTLVNYNGAPSGTSGKGGWLNYTPARAGRVEFEGFHPSYYVGFNNSTIAATGTQWANLTLVHLPWATLTVGVEDRDDGLPLFDAEVNATLPDGVQTGSTNVDGWVLFTTVVGEAHAGAQHPGYHEAIGGTSLVALKNTWLNLSLVRYTIITVRVFGENATAGPYPLANAAVSYNGTVVGYTNLWGYFNDSLLPGGKVWVSANASLYFGGDPIRANPQIVNYTGQLNVSVVLHERPLASLDLLLRDAQTGLVVPFGEENATNTDRDPTTVGGSLLTTFAGWANFTGDLGAGNYTLTGFHSGYLVVTLVLSHAPGTYALNWGQTLVETLYVVPLAYTKVFVDVVDANDTSVAVVGADVAIGPVYGFPYQTTTNSAGNATFPLPEVPGGTYDVEVTALGYWGWESPVPYWMYAGSHTTIHVELYPAPPKQCTPNTPGCVPNPNGTSTKGTLSLLPFASGPYWPFLLLPPIFLLGALVLFLATRKPRQGAPPPRRSPVARPAPALS
jgi:hypothetical protein